MTTNKENDARQFVRAMKADIRHQTRHMRWAVWALAGVGACTTIAGWMIPSPPAFILGGVLFAVALGIQFAAMRSFNSDKEIMGFVVQEDWKKLAQSVKAAYVKQDKMQIVEKTKLISILEAFGAAYNARSTNNEHDFYLGKLIGTGRIEGTVEQVMGTVPVQLEKSIKFIQATPNIYASQAAIFSETLINCLDKESFSTSLDIILAPYINVMEDIAKGNL
jgi:hypothetical protein